MIQKVAKKLSNKPNKFLSRPCIYESQVFSAYAYKNEIDDRLDAESHYNLAVMFIHMYME